MEPGPPRSPCELPGAGRRGRLPVVLRRREAEAAALVCHLPAPERERLQRSLRTGALCLKRCEKPHSVELPLPILRPLLLAALE